MPVTVSLVSDEKELEKLYRLRYKVYCQEWGFERKGNNSSELMTDVYDAHGIHFAARDEYEKIIGAVMLILNSPEGYPIEKHCELNLKSDEISKEGLAEISRLVIHRDYRRRAEDKYIYGLDEDRRSIGSFNFSGQYSNYKVNKRADDRYRNKQNARRPGDSFSDRRSRHEVLISLYKALYQESKRRKITHWYSFMTKGILMLLNGFGFEFQEIGDPVDYHGIRTPYLGEIVKIEEEMMNRNSELYNEYTKGL